MRIDILTLFPEVCRAPLSESMMKRAQECGALELHIHNLRDWTTDKHHIVDDAPVRRRPGDGDEAGADLRRGGRTARIRKRQQPASVLMTPQRPSDDVAARNQSPGEGFSGESHLIIICGHYEGVDHRVHRTPGRRGNFDRRLRSDQRRALPRSCLLTRSSACLPGVLGHEQSAADDSFSGGLLEGPQYTRPAEFRGWKVPDVLLSGNHAEIAAWRKEQALQRTRENRPDLLRRRRRRPSVVEALVPSA